MNSVPLIAAEFPVGNEMTAKLRVTVTSSQTPEPELILGHVAQYDHRTESIARSFASGLL